MPFVGVAALAGVLSVLAPCVVGLLPVLVGRSLAPGSRAHSAGLVIAGLCGSVFAFSVLLKATTLLIAVPQQVWQVVAGTILVGFGVVTLVPRLWDGVAARLRLSQLGTRGMRHGMDRQSRTGDVILGASLGPVFSACSPTYAVIVAGVLPAEPVEGVGYLAAYVAGLAAAMLVVVTGGRRAVSALGWGVDPHGLFRRVLGAMFVGLGVVIATGLDKELLSVAVQNGWFDWQLRLEDGLQ